MPAQFTSTPGGGASVALDEVEISILRSLAVQLLELIGPADEPEKDADPLAGLFSDGPTEAPSDPALARLFPDAYRDPDADPDAPARGPHGRDELAEKSAEFRRFTENDLREGKRADGLAMVRCLDEAAPSRGGQCLVALTPDDARHWLGALNDLRLTIGTRLEVTDEDEGGELYRLPDSDPRKPLVMAYLWLGALQETLVETLLP